MLCVDDVLSIPTLQLKVVLGKKLIYQAELVMNLPLFCLIIIQLPRIFILFIHWLEPALNRSLAQKSEPTYTLWIKMDRIQTSVTGFCGQK